MAQMAGLLRLKAWLRQSQLICVMAEGGIYAEDIVKNSQGVVGLVLEDAEETSDDSDSEEEALKKGQIVVCWYPSGNEETLSTSKVFVYFSDVYRCFNLGFYLFTFRYSILCCFLCTIETELTLKMI